MFIRKRVRRERGKTYVNYLLLESIRTDKGPRHRTVCSLGDLKPRPRHEWLKLARKVEDALVGQADIFEEGDAEVSAIIEKVKARGKRARDAQRHASSTAENSEEEQVVGVNVAKVRTEAHRTAGAIHAGVSFWRRLGLDNILAQAGLSERTCKLTCAMTLNRLIAPKSELAMPAWMRQTALPELLSLDCEGLSEDALYRNMDRLYPQRVPIESALFGREQTLFNLEQTIFLYDLTSTYFEGGAKGNPKAKRGYSRDKRPDCMQVVVGMAINQDGFPVAHEVFDGNAQDRATLDSMLDGLDRRVGLKSGQTVIVDRGMAFEENIAQIKARGLHYIVASRQRERDIWLSEFEALDGFEEVIRMPSPQNPFQKKSKIHVKMCRNEHGTYALCLSAERAEKDRAIREKQERRLLCDLNKLQSRVASRKLLKAEKVGEAIGRLKERYPRVARYYAMHYDAQAQTFHYARDEHKLAKAEQLDGGYLLKTDRFDITAEEIWRTYMLLTRAENAFRNMKSPLSLRPIFHHKEKRTETHIFLCILAYHLLVAIEKTLRDQGVHTSWATVRESLSSHQLCTIVLPTDDGAELRIRKASTPEPSHKDLYTLLDIPHMPMAPIRTWLPSNRSACSDPN